jgi:hypothetical protein
MKEKELEAAQKDSKNIVRQKKINSLKNKEKYQTQRVKDAIEVEQMFERINAKKSDVKVNWNRQEVNASRLADGTVNIIYEEDGKIQVANKEPLAIDVLTVQQFLNLDIDKAVEKGFSFQSLITSKRQKKETRSNEKVKAPATLESYIEVTQKLVGAVAELEGFAQKVTERGNKQLPADMALSIAEVIRRASEYKCEMVERFEDLVSELGFAEAEKTEDMAA